MTFSDHKNQHIFLMRVHTYVHCTAVAYPSESIFQRKCYEIWTIFKVLGNPKYIMSGPFGAIPSICFRGPSPNLPFDGQVAKNPTINNMIWWLAGPMGQLTCRPSVWCSMYYSFHKMLQNSLQKPFQSIFL